MATARGWCQKHYVRWKMHGDPAFTVYNMDGGTLDCVVDGCTATVVCTGRGRRGAGPATGTPMCAKHYRRHRRGEPLVRDRVRGDGHIKDGYLYVMAPDHPHRTNVGYVMQHRLVVEARLGRYLRPDEKVHHRNGVRDDNRIENLELWNTSHPAGQRAADKLAWAYEIVALYGPISDKIGQSLPS